MHKDDQNQFSEVESLKTKNPYARIDLKYTRETDYYFTVTALDENTGVVNGSSDPIPAIDPNATIYLSAGEKKCNGKNYAYSISLQQPIPNPVPANGLIFQPGVQGFLQLNQTCQYYDQNTGIVQPFWQAIDMVNYNQLPVDHPYKQVYNNNEFRYKHKDIASLGTSFFDAQNNSVTNGFLIEKKLDQFDHFNGDVTSLIVPSSTFMDMDMSGWNSIFNTSYADPTINGVFPTITEFSAQYGIPSEITCDVAFGTFNGGVSPSDDGEGIFEDNFVGSVFDCWFDNGDLEAYAACLDELYLSGGGIITDIIVIPLDRNGAKHHLQRDPISRTFTDLDFNSEYKNGLYELQIFTNQQQFFNSIVENVLNSNVIEDKDYVKMSISPNPIENNVMKLTIETSKEMNAQLVVYTLDNVVIHDAIVELSIDNAFFETIQIPSSEIPFNQIRVKLIFEDQSSMIQKTGIK